MNRLSVKQRKFVEKYAISGIGRAAAIDAGYPEKAATQQAADLLTRPYIKDALAQEERKLADMVDITTREIIEGIRKETQDKHAGNRLKAWDMLAKIKGLYADKQTESGSGTTIILNMGRGEKTIETDITAEDVVDAELVKSFTTMPSLDLTGDSAT